MLLFWRREESTKMSTLPVIKFCQVWPHNEKLQCSQKDQIFAEDSNHLSKQLTAAYTHIEMNKILNLLKYSKEIKLYEEH